MRSIILPLMRLVGRAGGPLVAGMHARRLRGPLILTPYCGWGTPTRIELRGRVLSPRDLGHPDDRSTRWANFVGITRRLMSREVRGVPVRAHLNGVAAEAVSDPEGFFCLNFELQEALPGGWHEAQVEVAGRGIRATARVLVVEGAEYGVISDLDDTVIQSNVTQVWQMLYTVFTHNSRTRLPFPGVAALYRALHHGDAGRNPIFYVSSSPWNFFDLLWSFLTYRKIPLGPLFLRDWGLDLLSGHGAYKQEVIQGILNRYPDLKFVLIGDSGEHDPEIYAQIVRQFPDRILAVYIRDVTGARRSAGVNKLREAVRRDGAELVLARDSLAAAYHAMALGLISPAEAKSVAQSVARAGRPVPNPFTRDPA